MFQLQPVGSVANIQICGTTSCMICGAEDLVAVCKEKIAPKAHMLSDDGKFSWEEVECLGACANAPMAQIGKDYYEDLTAARLGEIIDELAAGKVPVPGPQNGRYAAEPLAGLTSLKDFESGRPQYNASAQRAVDFNDTIKRIDGTEEPLTTPWLGQGTAPVRPAPTPVAPVKFADPTPAPVAEKPVEKPAEPAPVVETAPVTAAPQAAKTAETAPAFAGEATRPEGLSAAREGGPDDLKRIKGVGPKLELLLHSLGFYHFDQVANWGASEVAWVDDNLAGFKGRVSRDNWVEQARLLAQGGETAFSKKVDEGDVY
jgi:NADH-quinone oxidoreductase subunit E